MATTPPKKPGQITIPGSQFIELVFSWSLADVINKNLYKNKVQLIPDTFASSRAYLNSFVNPLLEETRQDLCSCLDSVNRAPLWKVDNIEEHKDFELPKKLVYELELNQKKKEDMEDLQFGSLVALTDIKPKTVTDVNRPSFPYLIAMITKSDEEEPGLLTVLSSRPIELGGSIPKELFAVGLSNINTNLRIWRALHYSDKEMPLIEKVLKVKNVMKEKEKCSSCSIDESLPSSSLSRDLAEAKLNHSQKEAILKCVARSKCSHEVSIELIWGPPGTGKTKTVACLLQSLLNQNCRMLTCAPTNIAVVEVADRVRKSVASINGRYGMGDIVLFGNKKRMKIDEDSDLLDIFLDHRIEVVLNIMSSFTGWSSSLRNLISLFENPKECYDSYVINEESKIVIDEEGEEEEMMKKKKNRKGDRRRKVKQRTHSRKGRGGDRSEDKKKIKKEQNITPMTYLDFLKKRFKLLGDRLMMYIVQICTHLPSSFLSRDQANALMQAHDQLHDFLILIRDQKEKEIRGFLSSNSESLGIAVDTSRSCCIQYLKELPQEFKLQRESRWLNSFYLENARLLFGTASGSVRLCDIRTPIEMLIIDEAGQLKECESAIPLQLKGLRHAVLVGDEKQLTAMVQSEIAKKCQFGRSLFERLVSLGYKRELLNVQYRMHPSISSFPNIAFYNKQISDGANVKEKTYQRQFLEGDMFGPYSFINIGHGTEQTESCSTQNKTEIAAIENIVERLSKASELRKDKLTLGVISPYKAQVNAIKDRIKRLTSLSDKLIVNVRSVDGFQGGEEDIILISAVRSNRTGHVGFLNNRQRTNVAITRAKHCAWILGNGVTLEKSKSVWADLLKNAKRRKCYFDAEDDKDLSVAIFVSLIEKGQIGSVLANPVFLKSAPWKVIFCDDFCKSLMDTKDSEVQKVAISFVQKLAFCWRPSDTSSKLWTSSAVCGNMLKQIRIRNGFTLIWSVDVEKAIHEEAQVIKIWGVKRLEDLPDLIEKMDTFYGNYSFETSQRCQYQRKDGSLVHPMQWSMDDPVDVASITSRIAALELNNE